MLHYRDDNVGHCVKRAVGQRVREKLGKPFQVAQLDSREARCARERGAEIPYDNRTNEQL